AVADGPHRLDAEEERVPERPGLGVRNAAHDDVHRREQGVRTQENGADRRDGHPPRAAQQRVIEVAQRGRTDADDADLIVRAGLADRERRALEARVHPQKVMALTSDATPTFDDMSITTAR